jgi:Flp pilus assembly protein TadG
MHNRRLQRDVNRRGATVVEFALVAPLFFATIFGSIEFGRSLMTTQSLEEAARSGCRVAVLQGATTSEIEAEVDRILGPVGISNYTIDVQPASIANAARWSPVSVTVSASFADMSWLPVPNIFSGKTYTSTCTLPKEYSPGN